MQEVVEALGKALADTIISGIKLSPFFSVCIDETTDVSVTKELIVYIRYISDGAVHFLGYWNYQIELLVQLQIVCVVCLET